MLYCSYMCLFYGICINMTLINVFITPLSGIPMFYIKYLTMHKVYMHAGAIRQLLYGCVYVREIIHSLKLVDYLPVHNINHRITNTCATLCATRTFNNL